MTEKPVSEPACHLCGHRDLITIPDYDLSTHMTSDCKPWPAEGRLRVCVACGAIQKSLDPGWFSSVGEIYRHYEMYIHSQGVEQQVFTGESGAMMARSSRLLDQLTGRMGIPEKGRLLDIGCGNGALLRAFNRLAPRWELWGSELDDKFKSELETIGGVRGVFTGPVEDIPGKYNLITMVHVLEHIPYPTPALMKIGEKLDSGGMLVVEVPDGTQNPFDFLILDHCSHFTEPTLRLLLQRAGFEIVMSAGEWIPKEITAIVRKNDTDGSVPLKPAFIPTANLANHHLQWLSALIREAEHIASNTDAPFGIFGTSIAGVWLFNELKRRVDFFVDEDIHRINRFYEGCPVYHPSDVPEGGQVFIAMPPGQAIRVKEKLEAARYPFKCCLPPFFQETGGSSVLSG